MYTKQDGVMAPSSATAEAQAADVGDDLVPACRALIAYLDANKPMGDSLWCVQRIRAALASRPVPQASEQPHPEFTRGFIAGRACEVKRPGPALAAKPEQPQAGASELPPLPVDTGLLRLAESWAYEFVLNQGEPLVRLRKWGFVQDKIADQMRDYAKAAIEANERNIIVFGGKRMGRNYLAGLEADKKRLDALTEESWQLDPTTLPTGGDDADIGWRVRQYYMGEVEPRTVAEVFEDSPRKAIDAAIASQGTEQKEGK